ncbi:MAG: thrombospondin type 3 repeat-containing protein [Candidatus Omnitrophica bacterium]|nr:thrombospondin type 3 repeat-containing protein [Candidatus Omnitrophota bacterium]
MNTRFFPWLQAMLFATALLPARAPAASVEVYGEANSSGEITTVSIFADITNSPLISFGTRLLYNPTDLRVVEAAKNSDAWFFSNGTAQAPYLEPDLSLQGEVLIIGGKMDGNNPLQGVIGNRILLGTAQFERLTHASPEFELAVGRPQPYANFVTTQGRVLESQPGEVVFAAVSPNPDDLDLDGLLDKWEIEYFKGTDQAYYDEDPDGDGFSNLQEQALGSDPTSSDSNLRLSISRLEQGVQLEWNSAPDRVYTVEYSNQLPEFVPLQTGIAATPPLNRYPVDLRNASFYRVVLETAP